MTSFPTLKNGLNKIRQNPQLTYTIVVAALITLGFVFMAERFVKIANDAQERLINVRIGSIQDAFVSFAGDSFDDPTYLNKKIREITANNATILSFRIIEKQSTSTFRDTYTIIASDKKDEMGKSDNSVSFLYNIAIGETSDSYTIETNENNERIFHTARAIKDSTGKVLGVTFTKQTLSEADAAIKENIARSILILILVIIVIMLLFLHHSKIIDYTTLYRKLKEVDKLKDDFISMASHELRTPLTAIRGYAEFIKDAPNLTDDTRAFASRIDISAKDLDTLVADILDVSRIEQGRMSFKMEKFDPREVIENAVSALQIPAKDKNLTLSFSCQSNGIISVDKERLNQVLVNIIGNAVKYTVKGEVKVSQTIKDKRLIVRISDTGLGMSAEEQKKLFEKFYRIKSKETENIRGTGLGLWITKQIVKEMGGIISVESIQGVGSHFIVSFPVQN